MKRHMALLPLYALVLVFLIPMILAFILYLYPAAFPLKTLNQGMLLSPMPTVENADHHWQVVLVPAGECGRVCERQEHQLRQMRKLFGENARRVVVTRQMTLAALPPGQIYLVDPVGNIFMYYPQNVNPMAIFKDMKRLLSVSQTG